ncbi:MAG: hypothetical protein KC503_44830 [Myxococcales bacterium]|nr:hypothetical protein [Myxococcales bacterium]
MTRRFTIALLAALLLAGAGCSDSAQTNDDARVTPDGGGDATPADVGVDAPAPLALGAFYELDADSSGKIAASLPVNGDETMMVLLLSLDDQGVVQHDYTVNSKIAAMRGAPPAPATPAQPSFAAASPWPAPRRCTFAQRLQRLLAEAKGKKLAPPTYAAASVPPKVGETREFKVGSGGGTPVTITAEAIHVDNVAVFWIDKTTTPLATISSEDLKQLTDEFANIIVPRERVYFGKESDVDGDGLISVLLSPLVAGSAVAYVSPCDLVNASSLPGCAASNGMELVYLSPPSSLQPPYNTARALLETVAHEFQHAIYFYRKFVLNQTVGTNENPYVTEGLSHLAQDLSGYQSGNLYVLAATLGEIDLVSVPNSVGDKILKYVPGSADGVLRGAGYMLLRYFFDQAGGDAIDSNGDPQDKGGIAWLRGFMDQPETGLASLLASTKMSYADLVTQYWTAVALSNRVAGGKPVSTDPRYNYLPTVTDSVTGRQRGCDLFGATHAGPIPGPATQDFDTADGKLRPGGAELLVLKVEKAGTLEVEVTTAAQAKARVRVIRIR